jgi:hypothetical protein
MLAQHPPATKPGPTVSMAESTELRDRLMARADREHTPLQAADLRRTDAGQSGTSALPADQVSARSGSAVTLQRPPQRTRGWRCSLWFLS